MQNIPQFGFDEELSQLINFYTSNPYLIPMALELGKSTRQMYAAATAKQLLAVSAVQSELAQVEKSIPASI